MEKQWTQWQIFLGGGSKIIADGDCNYEIKRHLLLGRKAMTNLDSIIKKQRHYFANKGLSSQGYGFSSSHVCMWDLDYKESWALKNWCFWTVVLEKTIDSPLCYKEIQPVNPKRSQSWIFIGRTGAEAETPILWPPDAKNWLLGKDPDAEKDWRQEEKGMTEDEMVDGITDAMGISSVQFSRSAMSDSSRPTDCSMPGLLVHHQLLELTQIHVHWFGDAIQPSHHLLSPSPPAFNLSQHQGLFQWVSSSHQAQLQHQPFQWIFSTDFL